MRFPGKSFPFAVIGLLGSLVFPLSVRGAVLTSPSPTGGFQLPGDGGIDGEIAGTIESYERHPPSEEWLQIQRERFLELLDLQLEAGNLQGAAITYQKIGELCVCLKDFDHSLDFYQKALDIYRQDEDLENQLKTTSLIIRSNYLIGNFEISKNILETEINKFKNTEKINWFIDIFQDPRQIKISCCSYIDWMSNCRDPLLHELVGFEERDGLIYWADPNLKWSTLLEISQFGLMIAREINKNRNSEASSLHLIGWAYRNIGEYSLAIEAYNNALQIAKEEKLDQQFLLWLEVSIVYSDLGEYQKALEILDKFLKIDRKNQNNWYSRVALNRIGEIYLKQGQYDEALRVLEEASNSSGWSIEDGYLFVNLGLAYAAVSNYPKAIESYQSALEHKFSVPDSGGKGFAYNGLGLAYAQMGDYTQAFKAYQDALSLFTKLDAKPGQRLTLVNIASLLETQGQIELAILFYKQAVNLTESIRGNLGLLTIEQQKAYLATVEQDYRHLADLLLQQNRVLEAQRVLDLLKVQELDDYLRGVRGNEQTVKGIDNLPPEQQLWDSYTAKLNQAIEQGKELDELRQIPEAERTAPQQQRLAELVATERQTLGDFTQFIDSEEVAILLEQLTYNVQRQSLDLAELNALRDNLRNLQQNAVLLYPLILEDRLELVLVTPFSPPQRLPVTVTRTELNRAIVEFRTALQNPDQDATQPAQKLYSWLIAPLETALTEANAETIIYAPDGQLRYIPLAALHDGNQWLVERFRINHITAASLTDLNTQPQTQPHILAGAFANGFYQVEVGNQQFNFRGLPFAGLEVENLATTVPQTTSLVDSAFNPDATIPRMDDYTVVHLATHAAFVNGRPEDSFILFGDGSAVTLQDVKQWSLQNVDLIVLSACETGLGGELGNGEEILGFGYLMQQAGARAAMASLWSVDDGGTQALMNAFYAALQGGKLSKAEALRQAQIALITGDYTALGESDRAAIEVVLRDRHALPAKVRNRLDHPFYWAPFILIGNGL